MDHSQRDLGMINHQHQLSNAYEVTQENDNPNHHHSWQRQSQGSHTKLFILFFNCIILIVWMSVGMYTNLCMYECSSTGVGFRGPLGGVSSLLPLWGLGKELGSSGLHIKLPYLLRLLTSRTLSKYTCHNSIMQSLNSTLSDHLYHISSLVEDPKSKTSEHMPMWSL